MSPGAITYNVLPTGDRPEGTMSAGGWRLLAVTSSAAYTDLKTININTMKVIKEGNKKPKETKRKCSKCKTVFTFTDEDIKPDWRDGDYVNCPGCGAFIYAR